VELAPPLLPPGLDELRGRFGKLAPQPRFPGLIRVDDEPLVGLLESLGMELEKLRSRFLELLVRDRKRDPEKLAAQRNALFSFSKNPSSVLYVSAAAVCSKRSSRSRCSSFSRRGTATLTRTR
jgi:hypothetical protein